MSDPHDTYAPYWAIVLVVLGTVGLSTIWLEVGDFWQGYVLDMTGPAWNYILFRGLYTTKANNVWTRFFTSDRTVLLFLLVCFSIEALQYFELYDATFDPWDLLAYVSILLPLYVLDKRIVAQQGRRPGV
jgi:hypothetical protein